jgi:hypothetical protein
LRWCLLISILSEAMAAADAKTGKSNVTVVAAKQAAR